MPAEDESAQHDTRCFSVRIRPWTSSSTASRPRSRLPLTVTALLAHLEIDARRVAVELNETVIKKALYDDTPIAAGDAVEIVNFVGGG